MGMMSGCHCASHVTAQMSHMQIVAITTITVASLRRHIHGEAPHAQSATYEHEALGCGTGDALRERTQRRERHARARARDARRTQSRS